MGILDSLWTGAKDVVGGAGDLLGFDGSVGYDSSGLAGQGLSKLGSAWGTGQGGVLNTLGDWAGFDGSFGPDKGDYTGSFSNFEKTIGFGDSVKQTSDTSPTIENSYNNTDEVQYDPLGNIIKKGKNAISTTGSYSHMPDTYLAMHMPSTPKNTGNIFTNGMSWLDTHNKGLAVAGGLAGRYLKYQMGKDAQKTLRNELAYKHKQDLEAKRKLAMAQNNFAGGYA